MEQSDRRSVKYLPPAREDISSLDSPVRLSSLQSLHESSGETKGGSLSTVRFAEALVTKLQKRRRPPVAERILKTCQKKLGTKPTVFGKRLRGELKPLWRLRVGDYRVIYLLRKNDVVVVGVLLRPDAYKQILDRLT